MVSQDIAQILVRQTDFANLLLPDYMEHWSFLWKCFSWTLDFHILCSVNMLVNLIHLLLKLLEWYSVCWCWLYVVLSFKCLLLKPVYHLRFWKFAWTQDYTQNQWQSISQVRICSLRMRWVDSQKFILPLW